MAYRYILKVVIIIALLLTIRIAFQEKELVLSHYSGIAMTIPYKVIVSSTFPQDKIEQKIGAIFSEVDEVFNNWNEQSEISKINKSCGNVSIPISDSLFKLLNEVNRLHKLSKGFFDPSLLPLIKLWKDYLEKNTTPPKKEILQAQQVSGWGNITLGDHCLTKKYSKSAIDLCGVSKGYAVDLLATSLRDLGVTSAYIEWGGEIRVIGQHPSKRPWRLFISNYEDNQPENALKILSCCDRALATSGDYLQNWSFEDSRVSHILDPFTGTPIIFPAGYKSSVTVIGDTCLECDAIATAVLATPLDARSGYINALREQLPYLQIEYFDTMRNFKER